MTKEQTIAAIDAWFNQRIATGPVARDTEAYNQVVLALPALKDALTADQPAPAAAPVAAESEADSEH